MSQPTDSSRQDPPFFKHLHARDRSILLRGQQLREEEEAKEAAATANMANEQTFIAIKPDGVQRGLVGDIISRFEKRGYDIAQLSLPQDRNTRVNGDGRYKLAAMKLVTPSKQHLEEHYEDLSEKPFFKGLVTYMLSGPICAMVWEGRDAVKTGRVLLGATNPLASAPGTIRGDYAIDVGRNVCHGSDSVENAKKEIALWFGKGEVIDYKLATFDWVYEKP
ncbi:nucleoside diphosphate kinase [Lambiella insularis]|nr:nucleoside diphosphate kinase [Lambiella insularis]